MPELLDLQLDLAAALRDAGASAVARRWLVGDAELLDKRLAIYRANVAASAAKALGGAYPVLRQVVGDEYFDGLAHAYRRLVPSISGDLTDYGAEFAQFLASFAPAQSLPYLPDLARLEWAVHRAYGAADAPAWNPAPLAQLAPARQASIRLVWAPGSAIVDSAFPLVRIWQIHQPDHSGEFSVDWSAAERALVTREGVRVTVSALGGGDAAFIGCSLSGATLGSSVEAALAADPAFDLGLVLTRAIASNAVCEFTLDEDQRT